MGVRLVIALLFGVSSQCALGHSLGQQSAQEQTQESDSGSSSSRKAGKKPARHIRVEETEAPPPELAQAEDFIQKHDYSSAEPLLRKVAEADPANYVAWYELGFVENGLGNIEESIAAYRKSVAARPDVFESNLNLGLQLAKANQPDAERFLRAATVLQPTSHEAEGKFRAWLSLGHLLEGTKPNEAIAAYRQAALLQPSDAEPHVAAGHLYEQQNQFADAEREYKSALAVDPHSDAVVGLANIYMRGRRLPEAEQFLRKLVNDRPNDADPHAQLGRVLAAENKNEEAISELETAARLKPKDISLQRDLADLYATAGKTNESEAAYSALIAAQPGDAGLQHSYGKVLLHQKKFVEAQKAFMNAVKLKPDFGEAYGDLAFAASENKDYGLVLKALDFRAKTLPEDPGTYFLRASAYDHLKDVKKAAANYHLFLTAANGKYPDQEWQAKHRLIALEPKK